MATRLRAIFPNIHNEIFKVYIDDTLYAGAVVDVEVAADGFSLNEEGGADPFNPIVGSKVTVSVIVTPDVDSDVANFAAALINAAEGRFTIRIDYNSGVPLSPDQLYWVGYILPDLSGFEDQEVYSFSITATDGIGRLKGIEYKDDSGVADAPYGYLTIQQHLLNCLNEDALSALYYNASSDVFLRTVVDWADNRIGGPTTAVCPTTRTRFSGEIFAVRDTSNDGNGWKFQKCYDVLKQICLHYGARLSYSLGCYRFEQVNSRTQDIITERRFSRNGTLVSSDNNVSYDKAITQAFAGFKIATILYNYLPALKKVTIDYDHDTYRNYLAGLGYKWYLGSGSNQEFERTNVKFDADSYIRISGRINVDLSVTTYTEPWRYIFGMELSVGSYKLRSFTDAVVDGSGNGINVIKREPVDWQLSSVYYEISTDFQYTNAMNGYINFSAYTSIVPSGVDSFKVDFYPLQGEDNQNNNHSVTVNNWQFTDLVLNIVGIDNADNYEANRKYELNNPDTGNSQTHDFKTIFGHPVKPWTPTKIQTSADGSTFLDTDATWAQGTETTSYEFGQLLAAEIMSLHRVPLRTLSGSINGNRIYYHSRLTTPDLAAWLPMSVRFDAYSGTWQGEWFQAGVDRFTGPIPIRRVALTSFPPGFGPGVFNPKMATLGQSIGQGNIALAALSTNHLSATVPTGAITSIDLEFPVGNNSYLAGDDIFLVNPATGDMIGLTVTATAAEGDTTLSVSGTADVDFPIGAHIVYSALNKSVQGYQGGNLPPGVAGQILKYGAQGWQGYSGTVDGYGLIWDSVNGWEEGPSGSGPQGPQGATGAQGVQGATGAQGVQGATGAQGTQGVQGTTGAQGTQGVQGAAGSTGPQGVQGATGAQGTQGVQGATGAQGNQGVQGAPGSTGPQGTAGAQGPQGFQGNTGSTGGTGPQGAQGAQGAQGSGGLTGSGVANRLAIWTGTTSLGSDDFPLYFDGTNNRLGVGTATPSAHVHVGIPTGTTAEGMRISGNLSGNLITLLNNVNNASTNANVLLTLATGGSAGGDPVLQLQTSGGLTWAVGMDNSDSDKFKISESSLPGTADRLIISSGGNVSIGTVVTTGRVNIAGSGTTSATYSMLVNNNSATTVLAVRDDQRVGILTTSPTQELHVNGDVIARQYMNTSAVPTVSYSTGAGTGAFTGGIQGGVNWFSFSFTTGTTPAANGNIFTITLNQSFPGSPVIVFSPWSNNTATDITKFYISSIGVNSFTVTANGTLSASTPYQFHFHVGGF